MIGTALVAAPHAHAQIPIITNLINGTDPDVLAGGTGFAAASTAWQAQIDSIVAGTTTTAKATSISASANTTDTIKKTAQDAAEAALYAASQQISRQLIAMTLNSINGGASGFDHPELFIRDFAQLTNDIANRETSVFTNALLNTNTNPFAKAAAVSLINSGVSTGLGAFNSTIDKIPGVDYRYASTDISTAGIRGWDFYSQLSMPQNTPIGTAMMARDTLAQNIQYAQRVKNQELSTSGYTAGRKACDINYTPPNPYAGMTDAQITALTETQKQQFEAQAGLANQEYALNCSNNAITKPKATVESLASQAVLAPFQKLDQNDKWFKLVFSTLTSLATGLIDIGISRIPSTQVQQFIGPGAGTPPNGDGSYYNPSNIPSFP